MSRTPKKEKCDWRLRIWREMLRVPPARVIFDGEHQSYRVEDGSFRYIYSDDIEDDEINVIVKEWAEQMSGEDRQRFVQTFSLKKLIEAFEDQRREIRLITGLTGDSGERVLTGVRFGQRTRAMIVEFTFQIIHADGSMAQQRGAENQLWRWEDIRFPESQG